MIETGLNGKVAIVTGAAAGIGKATALRFAAEGAKVVAWDVDADALATVREHLIGAGCQSDRLLVEVVDIASSDAVQTSVAAVMKHWGKIDVLINNAGILRDAQLVKFRDGEVVATMTEEDFDVVIAVNQRGVFLCTRAVVPEMIRGGGGVILNASSVVGLYGNFGQTNYAGSKAAVINMTKSWARELGRFNIRVNAVAPGFVATEMIRAMPQKILDGMVQHTPLQRMGTPEELAEVYLWLASDAASYIHGTVISVDGGLVLGT